MFGNFEAGGDAALLPFWSQLGFRNGRRRPVLSPNFEGCFHCRVLFSDALFVSMHGDVSAVPVGTIEFVRFPNRLMRMGTPRMDS